MKKIEAIIRKTKFEDVKKLFLPPTLSGSPTTTCAEKARCVRNASIVA